MENDQQRYFKLQNDLEPVKSLMGGASDAVIDQDVSSYPILVVHQQDTIGIGLELLNGADRNTKWSVNISTLEEFVTKQLIETARVDQFRQVFKDPSDHLCLFVIDEIGATFVFIPRN